MRLTLRLIFVVPVMLGMAVLCIADTPPDELQNPAATISAQSASESLAALDAAARSNAILSLEVLGETVSAWPHTDATNVEVLWNRGDHDQALTILWRLEAAGALFAPSISWREPVASHQKFAYQDRRIGDTRTGASDLHLDSHGGEKTIFAAVEWSDGWTMNASTDGGITWVETYSYGIVSKISMTVAGDYAWVAYSPTSSTDEIRMRRFDAETGNPDDVYFWELVADIGPAVVDDVALISNSADVNTAVYIAVIDGDDNLRTYWADLTGISFYDYSPAVTNADRNLDFTYCPYGFTSSGYVAFLTFESTTGVIEVWRMSFIGTWDQVFTRTMTGTNNYTSISAFNETVMTTFETDTTSGNGIQYWVSYNYGESWAFGPIYTPGTGDPSGFGADVSLHSGHGTAVTYHLEEGAMDNAYHKSRAFVPGSDWGDPFDYSNFDTMSGTQTEVNYLHAGCVGSYGMLYLGDTAIPYFDLMTPRGFFCDGFDSGSTSAWD